MKKKKPQVGDMIKITNIHKENFGNYEVGEEFFIAEVCDIKPNEETVYITECNKYLYESEFVIL